MIRPSKERKTEVQLSKTGQASLNVEFEQRLKEWIITRSAGSSEYYFIVKKSGRSTTMHEGSSWKEAIDVVREPYSSREAKKRKNFKEKSEAIAHAFGIFWGHIIKAMKS